MYVCILKNNTLLIQHLIIIVSFCLHLVIQLLFGYL